MSVLVQKLQRKINKENAKIRKLYNELDCPKNYLLFFTPYMPDDKEEKNDAFPKEFLEHEGNRKTWKKIINIRKNLRQYKADQYCILSDPYKSKTYLSTYQINGLFYSFF